MIQSLQNLLSERLQSLGISDISVQVIVTDDPSHGDYATNIAFVLAKKLQVSPMEAASILANNLASDMPPILSQVEVAKPGFLNMRLSTEFLLEQLESRLFTSELKILSAAFANQKIMIEFTDPNPFKEFHIGHLYSNIVGESISRLLEAVGAEVKRVNYQGDVGLHVAKSVWGMQQLKAEMPEAASALSEKAKFLGKAYALGSTKYEEDLPAGIQVSAKEEITELNKQIYDKSNPEVMELYKTGKQWSLDYFETIYQRLGTTFWHYYFESEAGPVGVQLVKEYLDKGVFEQSNGAVVFPGEKYGLHTRVFINSLGLPTYEAKELGLAPTKYKDYAYDLSIIITGNEINDYFKVLIKALTVINPNLGQKTKHLSHGMVRLPEGKMSSRTGKVVTGEWLLDEAVERAGSLEQRAESREEVYSPPSALRLPRLAEMVGVGAIKWALLRSGIGKDVEFSFDDSISFEGNSGPYLQYSYVRSQSVVRKAQKQGIVALANLSALSVEPASEERQLLVYLTRYNDVIVEAAERYSPNIVTTYLFELAKLFNLFYQKYPILKEEGILRDFRLGLTKAVGITIKNGLTLLGIKTPERM